MVKKQHYLPQFYLRRFADERERICVVDASLPSPYIYTRVADIAQKRYFYDFIGDGDNQSIEKLFGILESELAKEFKSIGEKISKGNPLDENNKKSVLSFLKLQMIRSDRMRSLIPHEKMRELFVDDYAEKLPNLLHAYIIHQEIFVGSVYTSMLDYLLNYDIIVLKSKIKGSVYTSSSPIFLHSNGNSQEIIERLRSSPNGVLPNIMSNLFMPFSSDTCLYFYDPQVGINFDISNWESELITTGLSWCGKRIYFRHSEYSIKLFPMLKRVLQNN